MPDSKPFSRQAPKWIRGLGLLLLGMLLVWIFWESAGSGNKVVMKGSPFFLSMRGLGANGMNADHGTNGWRQLGPNALPILLEAIQTEEGPVRRIYVSLWSKLPGRLAQKLPSPGTGAVEIRWGAMLLVVSNPADAKPLAPYILKVLKQNKDPHTRKLAVMCLANIGEKDEETVLALTRALADKDPEVRVMATHALEKLGPVAAAGGSR